MLNTRTKKEVSNHLLSIMKKTNLKSTEKARNTLANQLWKLGGCNHSKGSIENMVGNLYEGYIEKSVPVVVSGYRAKNNSRYRKLASDFITKQRYTIEHNGWEYSSRIILEAKHGYSWANSASLEQTKNKLVADCRQTNCIIGLIVEGERSLNKRACAQARLFHHADCHDILLGQVSLDWFLRLCGNDEQSYAEFCNMVIDNQKKSNKE